VLSRKKITPALLGVENIVTDFSNLESLRNELKVHHVYCALGTTMAKAGSKKTFRQVDYEIPLKIAEISKQMGAEKFLLVSAIGAHSKSIFFYIRVKGELEKSLEKLHFKSLIIFQPSILLGERSEFRLGEFLGKQLAVVLSFMFTGALKNYKGIEAVTVAKAMIVRANSNSRRVERLTYSSIEEAAEQFGIW
jgi:uncharacterized protein YbjT (DUF2867 family)